METYISSRAHLEHESKYLPELEIYQIQVVEKSAWYTSPQVLQYLILFFFCCVISKQVNLRTDNELISYYKALLVCPACFALFIRENQEPTFG